MDWRRSLEKLHFFKTIGMVILGFVFVNAEVLHPTQAVDLEKVPSVLVDRPVLQVEDTTYYGRDLIGLEMVWNILENEKRDVHKNIDWLTYEGQDYNIRVAFKDQVTTLPIEVKKILFITFVYVQSKKTNLFQPSVSEVATSLEKIKSILKSNLSGKMQTLKTTSPKLLEFYVDAVLRAQPYKRLRGGLESNVNLADIYWFWYKKNKI